MTNYTINKEHPFYDPSLTFDELQELNLITFNDYGKTNTTTNTNTSTGSNNNKVIADSSNANTTTNNTVDNLHNTIGKENDNNDNDNDTFISSTNSSVKYNSSNSTINDSKAYKITKIKKLTPVYYSDLTDTEVYLEEIADQLKVELKLDVNELDFKYAYATVELFPSYAAKLDNKLAVEKRNKYKLEDFTSDKTKKVVRSYKSVEHLEKAKRDQEEKDDLKAKIPALRINEDSKFYLDNQKMQLPLRGNKKANLLQDAYPVSKFSFDSEEIKKDVGIKKLSFYSYSGKCIKSYHYKEDKLIDLTEVDVSYNSLDNLSAKNSKKSNITYSEQIKNDKPIYGLTSSEFIVKDKAKKRNLVKCLLKTDRNSIKLYIVNDDTLILKGIVATIKSASKSETRYYHLNQIGFSSLQTVSAYKLGNVLGKNIPSIRNKDTANLKKALTSCDRHITEVLIKDKEIIITREFINEHGVDTVINKYLLETKKHKTINVFKYSFKQFLQILLPSTWFEVINTVDSEDYKYYLSFHAQLLKALHNLTNNKQYQHLARRNQTKVKNTTLIVNSNKAKPTNVKQEIKLVTKTLKKFIAGKDNYRLIGLSNLSEKEIKTIAGNLVLHTARRVQDNKLPFLVSRDTKSFACVLSKYLSIYQIKTTVIDTLSSSVVYDPFDKTLSRKDKQSPIPTSLLKELREIDDRIDNAIDYDSSSVKASKVFSDIR